MTLLEHITSYELGFSQAGDLPDLAITALEEGYDSETLRILAGRSVKDNPFLLNDEYQQAVKENNFLKPSGDLGAKILAGILIKPVVDGKIEPYVGFDNLNDFLRTTSFWYEDLELQPAYVLYITLGEVLSDGLQLHTGSGLSKPDFILATESELRQTLRMWWMRLDTELLNKGFWFMKNGKSADRT